MYLTFLRYLVEIVQSDLKLAVAGSLLLKSGEQWRVSQGYVIWSLIIWKRPLIGWHYVLLEVLVCDWLRRRRFYLLRHRPFNLFFCQFCLSFESSQSVRRIPWNTPMWLAATQNKAKISSRSIIRYQINLLVDLEYLSGLTSIAIEIN